MTNFPKKGEIVLICDDYLNYYVYRFLGYSEKDKHYEFEETVEDYYTKIAHLNEIKEKYNG